MSVLQNYPPEMVLVGGDGKSYVCQLLDVINYDQNEYALLLHKDNGADGSGQESILIMKVIQSGGNSTFQTIETEEEFESVHRHIETLVKEIVQRDQN